MSEEKNAVEKAETLTAVQAEEAAADRRHVVKFKRPYTFEKKEYAEVDMSGLERLTVKDAIEAQRQLFNRMEVAASMITETTTAFALELAVRATGKPVEFFQQMPRGMGKQIIRAVRGFMNVENNTENHVLRLEKPYVFQGQTYTEIDLGGVADLSVMHEGAAENRMAREGFVVTETSFNYFYACVIANMSTGLPEEFFTGLPIYEVLKLKNAVNDGGFFE